MLPWKKQAKRRRLLLQHQRDVLRLLDSYDPWPQQHQQVEDAGDGGLSGENWLTDGDSTLTDGLQLSSSSRVVELLPTDSWWRQETASPCGWTSGALFVHTAPRRAAKLQLLPLLDVDDDSPPQTPIVENSLSLAFQSDVDNPAHSIDSHACMLSETASDELKNQGAMVELVHGVESVSIRSYVKYRIRSSQNINAVSKPMIIHNNPCHISRYTQHVHDAFLRGILPDRREDCRDEPQELKFNVPPIKERKKTDENRGNMDDKLSPMHLLSWKQYRSRPSATNKELNGIMMSNSSKVSTSNESVKTPSVSNRSSRKRFPRVSLLETLLGKNT